MEDKKQSEPVYEKSTAQLDAEMRRADDYVPPSQLISANEPGDTPLDNAGYIGVDPVYQNAANETEQPMRQTEGVEADIVSDAGHDKNTGTFDGESPVPEADEYDDDEKEEEKKDEQKSDDSSSSTPPPAPSAPTAKKAASSNKSS